MSICKDMLSKPIKNAICLKFPTLFKSLFNTRHTHFYSAINLWLNFDVKKTNKNATQKIRLSNLKNDKSIFISIKNDWNSIDITNLIETDIDKLVYSNDTIFDVLVIKCHEECQFELNQFNAKPTKIPTVILKTHHSHKPLLQINNIDKNSERNEQINKQFEFKRLKRVYNDVSMTNICKNNQLDPKSKCCLMPFRLDFSMLKLTQWIISPLSFSANYCFGHCSSSSNSCKKFKIKGF